MNQMGFDARWIALIMECISTVSYSILINGEPSDVFHPSRGLRQGDLLSPLNQNKMGLFFSKSTPPSMLILIKELLGVQEIKQHKKYLGLPSLVGKHRKASLLFIKERVLAKLQGWKEQLLSQVGHEILLKAVIQAILTFAMGCFKIPITLCEEIESLIRKF